MQSKAHWLSLPTMICMIVLFCVAAVIASAAQSVFFTSLASFDGTNGTSPGSLIIGTDGNLYGTTYWGGTSANCTTPYGYGCGTVFKITIGGVLTTLYNFCSEPNCADGKLPNGGLVQGSDGNLYGATAEGGGSQQCEYGCGTVFKITPSGTLTTLHSFELTDGAYPTAGLVQASDRNFYGTTGGGGAQGDGTVFTITPQGTLTTLHSFDGSDGIGADGLMQARDGNFYGTTGGGGGSGNCYEGCGTVFKITPSGTLTTLHSFEGTDGDDPLGVLLQASDGNFYGTTLYSLAYPGDGTVFKITATGTFNTLYTFSGSDGGWPYAGLVQGSDGNLYGTTYRGGTYDWGTVFRITTTGALTTLHSFNLTDGQGPSARLLQSPDGVFYGNTWGGGAYYNGTVFRLGMVRTCATCRP